ncbi:MAG: RNA polymerase Rbp10 [Thaumarchaeota archaeon]|nr:MAG: RNA polymerase Rbp10 [Nitrososphaerota archaeon]
MATEESSKIEAESEQQQTSFSVIYTCLRCGTQVTQSELSRLPEIKCICGFRVFNKLRPPIVKTIKAV